MISLIRIIRKYKNRKNVVIRMCDFIKNVVIRICLCTCQKKIDKKNIYFNLVFSEVYNSRLIMERIIMHHNRSLMKRAGVLHLPGQVPGNGFQNSMDFRLWAIIQDVLQWPGSITYEMADSFQNL